MLPSAGFKDDDELIEADTELDDNPPRGACAIGQVCAVYC